MGDEMYDSMCGVICNMVDIVRYVMVFTLVCVMMYVTVCVMIYMLIYVS